MVNTPILIDILVMHDKFLTGGQNLITSLKKDACPKRKPNKGQRRKVTLENIFSDVGKRQTVHKAGAITNPFRNLINEFRET